MANIEILQCVARGVPGDHCRCRKIGQRAQDIYIVSCRPNHWATESRDPVVQWFGRQLTPLTRPYPCAVEGVCGNFRLQYVVYNGRKCYWLSTRKQGVKNFKYRQACYYTRKFLPMNVPGSEVLSLSRRGLQREVNTNKGNILGCWGSYMPPISLYHQQLNKSYLLGV